MLRTLWRAVDLLLPGFTVEYIYTTDIIKHHSLGICTKDEAILKGVNLYTSQTFGPSVGGTPLNHKFGIHRSDCERVALVPESAIACDVDVADGFCWSGVVEIHRGETER